MKILVIDSTALSDATDEYRSFFLPHIKLIGHEPSKGYAKTASGAHGYQCGYYAGVLLNLIPGDHEIHFARIFDQNSEWIRGSEEFILDTISNVAPQIVTNSWGQDDGDIDYHERQAARSWSRWANRFRWVVNNSHTVSFFAAGNDDKNDPDDDVAFPQRLIPETANIVGSHNRSGKPSKFSGDGAGVQVTFWGERLPLLNGYGRWELGSGTSFSCPKAAGLCAYLGLDHFGWRKYVRENAKLPRDWAGKLPHPKWGEGSLEYSFQDALSLLPERFKSPASILRRRLMYMDHKKLT
jgi:hypothetical protein